MASLKRKRVLTFGSFDLFHFGHLKLLQRAAALGDELFVGISSDSLNIAKKGRAPVMTQQERANIVASLRYVNVVFLEESLELKREYLLRYEADILVMGDDWAGKFDEFNDICKVVYLPRTKDISTTELLERIKSDFKTNPRSTPHFFQKKYPLTMEKKNIMRPFEKLARIMLRERERERESLLFVESKKFSSACAATAISMI